ncbi:uncharacterized PE-PGRS family protein PE_PGRS20 isoform X1 [Thunnus albacares]|uniref:uncharacterized PE-PGRS family protein PE_PGRS20 isoform X1 n=2 Tax=Thunnus albacares TaxID=8236 RepID=UPI001CF6818F|nr:uncharacterized PE-PGRS family protein PE_PGRS20 isoform X1 [Thunnus albacares]
MLVPALLQTSLILWLAQQTLQGGVKPQSVAWGRMLPARGVGIGVKPGAGALGALGSRYGSKAMKTGIGRYPAAQPGAGGYRALGVGGRTSLKQGGYVPQGANGASLGLGAGLPNGLGMGLGQGGKRVYGAGVGTLPGYGTVPGMGQPAARSGVSAADLGQAVQDLKTAKSRTLGSLFLGPEMPDMRRSSIIGHTAPELQKETGFRPDVLSPGTQVKSLDPLVKSPSLGPTTFLDKISRSLGRPVPPARGGEIYGLTFSQRKSTASHGATMATGGARQQHPVDEDNIRNLGSSRDYDSSIQKSQQARNYGSTRDLSDASEMEKYRELLASEAQRAQGLAPQPRIGKDGKHLGLATPQAQGEETYQLSQSQDTRTYIFSLPPPSQRSRIYLSAGADGQGVENLELAGKYPNSLKISGTVVAQNHNQASANPQMQRVESNVPVIPGASGTKNLASAGGQEGKGLFQAEHDGREPKALDIPEQTGRSTQGTSYNGGVGTYPGAGLGPGGYGPGLGQGAYLGGAAGKLGAAALGQGGYPHGVAGKSNGYGDGAATGYLGPMAANGYGYPNGNGNGNGNGYGDGYRAGHGYPSELADVAENKAGKSQGAYAGQPQAAYGPLGAGLESPAGKYGGGAAQVPYGGAPVIPTGLEGDVGYPYGAQHLGPVGESAKASNKNGAGAGYGVHQTGYGAQLGATQDVLGEPVGKYGGANGNGYKG